MQLAPNGILSSCTNALQKASEMTYSDQHPTAPHQLNWTNLLPASKTTYKKTRRVVSAPSKKSHH